MKEKECTVFCPKCNVDKFDVYRVSTNSPGVYAHVMEPADMTNFDSKYCVCGAVLERRS